MLIAETRASNTVLHLSDFGEGMTTKLIIPEHGLEHEHVPVPADHAPRLEVVFTADGVSVYERGNPDSFLLAENPVEIRR